MSSTPTSTQVQSPKQPTRFNRVKLRKIAFHAHRWLALTAGILLCIAGVTGSILVFWRELDPWLLTQRFGAIRPVGTTLSIATLIEHIKTTYANYTLTDLSFPNHVDHPYIGWLEDATDHYLQVFINPYTGKIIADRQWETSWVGRILQLHFNLLAGDTGLLIMGIVALLTLMLSLTGILLWPGWRKLAAGFKIKWDGHIKRLNFDLHKVFGIVTVVFLALISFTGFAWNVPQAKVTEAIYVLTLTAQPPKPVSRPIAGQQPLAIDKLLQRADAAVPDATTTYVTFANEPEAPFRVGKKQAQESGEGNTQVYLDQFTGEVIQLNDVTSSRAEAILNQFKPVHYGTFWGLPSRILYVFVGLAQLLLFITGFVMWRYRKQGSRRGDQVGG